MDLEIIKLNQRKTSIIYLELYEEYEESKGNSYMRNLKKKMIKRKLTHRLRKRTYGYQMGRVGGRERLGVWG